MDDNDLSSLSNRLTEIEEPVDVEYQNFKEELALTIFLTEKGWIKAIEGHATDETGVKLKDKDKLIYFGQITTERKLLLFTNIGKVYSIYANKLAISNDFEPIKKYLNLRQDEFILHISEYSLDESDLILISKTGKGIITKQKEMLTSTRNGKVLINLPHGASLGVVRKIIGSHIAIINDLGNLLVFDHRDIKRLSRGSGVIFQNLKNGKVIDLTSINLDEQINLVNKNTNRSVIKANAIDYLGARGRIGKKVKLRNFSNIPLLRFISNRKS